MPQLLGCRALLQLSVAQTRGAENKSAAMTAQWLLGTRPTAQSGRHWLFTEGRGSKLIYKNLPLLAKDIQASRLNWKWLPVVAY